LILLLVKKASNKLAFFIDFFTPEDIIRNIDNLTYYKHDRLAFVNMFDLGSSRKSVIKGIEKIILKE